MACRSWPPTPAPAACRGRRSCRRRFGRMYSPTTGNARLGYRPSKKSIKHMVERVHALSDRAHIWQETTGPAVTQTGNSRLFLQQRWVLKHPLGGADQADLPAAGIARVEREGAVDQCH